MYAIVLHCDCCTKWTRNIRNLKTFMYLPFSSLIEAFTPTRRQLATTDKAINTNTGTTQSSVINFLTLTSGLANISISFAASSFSSQLPKWSFFTQSLQYNHWHLLMTAMLVLSPRTNSRYSIFDFSFWCVRLIGEVAVTHKERNCFILYFCLHLVANWVLFVHWQVPHRSEVWQAGKALL